LLFIDKQIVDLEIDFQMLLSKNSKKSREREPEHI